MALNPKLEATLETNHALIVTHTHKAVTVSKKKRLKSQINLFSLHPYLTCLAISVGSWSSWGSWGPCSSACGSGTQTRTRSYSGARPCLDSDTSTQSCAGKLSYMRWWMEMGSSPSSSFSYSGNMVIVGLMDILLLNELLIDKISISNQELQWRGTSVQWQCL